MLLLFENMLIYFDICFIFEKAGTYRARRGAGTSIFGATFSKKSSLFAKSNVCIRKVNIFIKKSSGISRNRSGTVSRVPGRSTCTYNTRDELRSSYACRVMII